MPGGCDGQESRVRTSAGTASHREGFRRECSLCRCGRRLRAGADHDPVQWTGGKQTAVIGLTSVKLNKDTIISSYTLGADSAFCDYDPIKKKIDIGSNFWNGKLSRGEQYA